MYNHWTGLGLVDWTGGLTLKIIFTLFNKTYLPVELCGNPVAFSLYTHTVMEQIAYNNSEGLHWGEPERAPH